MNRYKDAKIASIFGIIGNIFGAVSCSQAMIADAMNSGSDIFSSLLSYIGNKIASKPRDKDHNLGHGKAEYIFSLFISIVMFILAVNTLISSLTSLLKHQELIYSNWLVWVCLTTIVIKLVLFIYADKISKKYNNLLMKANSRDHRNDMALTSLNLTAILFAKYDVYFIDGIVGTIISLWIFITSFKIFKESYDVLMDKSIDSNTEKKVLKIIKSHDEIKGFRHFNSTPIGYKYQISFTIFVDGNMSTYASHKIADDLEREIASKMPEIYLTVIHVNPVEDKNEK